VNHLLTDRHFEGFSYREFVDARGGDSCGLRLKRKRLAIDLRFRNEIPPVLCFVLDYFVSLWIVDHIVYLVLTRVGSYRIIQRASMKGENASSSILESPEDMPEK
jgi:hypothetical protein